MPQQKFYAQVTTLPDCDDITRFDGTDNGDNRQELRPVQSVTHIFSKLCHIFLSESIFVMIYLIKKALAFGSRNKFSRSWIRTRNTGFYNTYLFLFVEVLRYPCAINSKLVRG